MIQDLNHKVDSEKSLINSIKTYVYKIPTDFPESDGTIEWDSTTLIAVLIHACGQIGLGFTYGHEAVSQVIHTTFAPILKNSNAMNVPFLWEKMLDAVAIAVLEELLQRHCSS